MTMILDDPEFITTMKVVAISAVALTILAHIVLASATTFDAARLKQRPSRLCFMEPWAWFLVTLVTGILGFMAYWVIHYSTFMRSDEDPPSVNVLYAGNVRQQPPPPAEPNDQP